MVLCKHIHSTKNKAKKFFLVRILLDSRMNVH